MIRVALAALESPDRIAAEVAFALEADPGPGDQPPGQEDQWLLLLAAALCSRPDLVNATSITHLETLLQNPALGSSTSCMAGEVLKFAVSSPVGKQAVEAAMRLLSDPGNLPEVYEAAIDSLRWATCWAANLLDPSALLGLAGLDTLVRYRSSLLRDIVEPGLYASETIPQDRLSRWIELCADPASAKYCVYYLHGKEGLAGELRIRFPLHESVASRLGQGPRRVLVVHNINDGQGDEIVRVVPLAQAFLDFNPELEIVLVTRRTYLYAHPRISPVPIAETERIAKIFREPFDGLVDFFDPDIREVNYDPGLEILVEEFRRQRRPFLDIGSKKGYNHFLYDRVGVDSQALASALGLDRRRVDNNYEPAQRLIAELGFPHRRGQQTPRAGPALADTAWPEADRYWRSLTSHNQDHRPVAMLSPFGGSEPLKGHVRPDGVAAEIGRLVREGYFVVVMPNGARWGSTCITRNAVALLPPDELGSVVIGPAPDGNADTIPVAEPGGTALSFPDTVMRLVLYGVRHADLVVTVEGWMMHAAYCLGKPYRVLMLAYSHPQEWHPYGRTHLQGVFPVAGFSPRAVVAPPLVLEQPRKFLFLFLLRALGKTGAEDALPLLQRAITSDDRHIRLAAAEALAGLGSADVERSLAPLLWDSSHEVRAVASQAFLDHSWELAGVPRETLMVHRWIGSRERNWEPVLRLGEAARPAVELAAKGDDPVVRREAAAALRILDFKAGTPGKPPAQHKTAVEGVLSPFWRRVRDSSIFRMSGPARSARSKQAGQPKVLILTPAKDAELFIPGYYKRITRLTYPGKLISLGFLESDSGDATYAELEDRLPRLRKRFRRVGLWKKDFGFRHPGFPRWAEHLQAERRSVLAKSRNHLLFHALDDEVWVLWLDVDVIEYPNDVLERLLATGKDIVQPHCVVDYGGPTFDRNAWRDHGRLHLEDLRDEGDLVPLDAVGGTMLLVRADLHREGLVFPPWPHGRASASARASGELETEGLGILASDMGYRCWGMPRLEIRHGRW